ncbi:MAG: hypothetical protein QXY40_11345 [Candidatus Methanomethylicia archaeon]
MSYGFDVRNLLRKLLLNYRGYFSNDVLNSEGRKVFEEMARMLIHEHPEHKPIIQKARRNPSLKNILKIARIVLDEDIEDIIKQVDDEPYTYYY